MKCTNCGFDNEADAKFCENCGESLEQKCPNCGNAVKPGQKFCKTCGFKLGGAAATPPRQDAPRSDVPSPDPSRRDLARRDATDLMALRRTTPAPLAEKIRAEGKRNEGERKLVTALFTDIVGSTSLAEQMDPEDWREIVNGAHERVSAAVYRYEGTIAQLLGDGVLAFFGAPIAHEDDAERAIRASLDILEAVKNYAGELQRTRRIPSFQMRIGLNTGLVVVGNVGSDLHMEYLAIGDTVNLAARMQSAAEADTVLISQHTQRPVSKLFEFDDRGEIAVKGKAEPVRVYRVLGEVKGAPRQRGIAGLTSPLVGRQRELSTLAQALTEARAGRGSIVSVIGEAGLGKSRLIAEWRKLATAGDMPLRWVEGRCLSYTMNVAHHLSTDVLRGLCGAPAGASDEEAHAALKTCVSTTPGLDAGETYPYLGHLMGAQLDDDSAARVKYLDGAALQARYVSAYSRFVLAMAKHMPTVIVCDDVHWADPSSVELMAQVARVAEAAPVAFAYVTRPDSDAPGWRLISQSQDVPGVGSIELRLAPLNDTDSRQLVSNLLEVEALPDALRQLILNKAEGNPFFVEEVVRMLIDRGGITRNPDTGRWSVTRDIHTIDIPDTLQGVLAARIDRLPEETKRVLQIASVIGRRFQVRVLEAVLAQHKM